MQELGNAVDSSLFLNEEYFFGGGRGGKNCPRNIPSVGIFRESPELRKVQVKKEKSAYNNFVYNDWTTINPQATVQTRCLQSVHPLPSPARHELRPEERWRGKPLPHLTQLRQQETEPITTAERLQQLERASPEWWWQKWRVSLLEVQGVKVLALKKSLEERQVSRN